MSEVEITREGDALILRPARKTWTSFTDVPLADSDFLGDREDVIGRGTGRTLKKTFMLDTNICSYIMRERPEHLLKVLQAHVENKRALGDFSDNLCRTSLWRNWPAKLHRKHNLIVDQFLERIDSVLPWDQAAVEATTEINAIWLSKELRLERTMRQSPGNAIAANCVLVTNNRREFDRVPQLTVQDWTA